MSIVLNEFIAETNYILYDLVYLVKQGWMPTTIGGGPNYSRSKISFLILNNEIGEC